MQKETITECFKEAAGLFLQCAQESHDLITSTAEKLIQQFKAGRKLLLCGNGGSASQTQHFASEFVNRLVTYRKALPAIALTTDTSILTSIGNDLDFNDIFSRQVEALGTEGDILMGLSTSGRSANVINAFKTARKQGLFTVSFTGKPGSTLSDLSDISLSVPSDNTARIQEIHLCWGHILCKIIETHFLSGTETISKRT
jgi:D-sedoheptulose 7-phosphate isomerase